MDVPWRILRAAAQSGDPESTQAVSFIITGNTHPEFFSAQPSVSPTGTLTYDEPWKVEDRGEKPAIALKGR